MPHIDLPGGTIHHRVEGPADGPPVVFVHGALVDGTLWDGVADRLAATGHRTHAPDWPLGSHRTPMAADADLSPVGQAARIDAYLAALDLHDVTLVANDSGGAITQLLLAQGAPRVGRVVFTNCDTFDRFPPPSFGPLFRLARHPRLSRALLQAMRSANVRRRVGYGPLAVSPIDDATTWRWIEPALTDARIARDFARFAAGIERGMLTRAAASFARFPGDVLVAWGPADRFFRIADGRRLAAAFPEGHATVVEIADAKTFVAQDQPERLAELVARFVSSGTHADAPGTRA